MTVVGDTRTRQLLYLSTKYSNEDALKIFQQKCRKKNGPFNLLNTTLDKLKKYFPVFKVNKFFLLTRIYVSMYILDIKINIFV